MPDDWNFFVYYFFILC